MNQIWLNIILSMLFFFLNGGNYVVADADLSQETTKKLQGNWSSIWINARSDKIDENVQILFTGDMIRFSYKEGVKPLESKFRIISSDESGNGSIDITDPASQKLVKGLYILKRDTLILFIPDAGAPRPKEISANLKMDENKLFLILVRDK